MANRCELVSDNADYRSRILDALFLKWDCLPEDVKVTLAKSAAELHGDYGRQRDAKDLRVFAERSAMQIKRHHQS